MGRKLSAATLSFFFIVTGLAGCTTDISDITGEKEASAAERHDQLARPAEREVRIRFQPRSQPPGSFEYRPQAGEYLSTIKLEPRTVLRSGR